METQVLEQKTEEERGVLLYYCYVNIPDTELLKEWYTSLCFDLSLVGRVRIASEGVNVTVGGTISSLQKHINSVESHPWLGPCDFKLTPAYSSTPSESKVVNEVGFSNLCVRVVKELITLGIDPSKCPSLDNAGVHLNAQEFHSKIQQAEYAKKFTHSEDGIDITCGEKKNVLVLDVRNIYETRIGRFDPPEGVEFFDPKIRQYSDLPRWIDENVDKFKNKSVYMYCTGGVRCERASAYIKSKGKGFEDVFQLSGGIQRYLEAFPDGGYFKGKNFVFDYRISVPSTRAEIVGSCLSCGSPYDDYSSRIRCFYCRMLILICKSCQDNACQNPSYACELCNSKTIHDRIDKRVEDQLEKLEIRNAMTEVNMNTVHSSLNINSEQHVKRKLRILCLHGFRQNASGLKGRLASFTKKLKDIAEFVFIDGPHSVPVIFSRTKQSDDNSTNPSSEAEPENHVRAPKYAWLVTPEMLKDNLELTQNSLNSEAFNISKVFEKDQYRKQTVGWAASLDMLKKVFQENGPFDGVLGFSQGAAVAASLCFWNEFNTQKESDSIRFKFVILCSGFLSRAPEHQSLISSASCPLRFPSLHIFGEKEGCDRQISVEESTELVSLFAAEQSLVLKHKSGHILPCQKEYIQKVKTFLNQYVNS